jgi:hypothetical protein
MLGMLIAKCRVYWVGLALVIATAVWPFNLGAQEQQQVDTALVVSVDVSNSVDDERYKLQMEGIAKALEDPSVIDAIASGPNGGILFAMVTWADRPTLTLPWVRISNRSEAEAVAKTVRQLPRIGGEFTCMTKMLRSANDKIISQIPARVLRVIIDVSGDGADNCNTDEPIDKVRDELVGNGVTINGLPILLDVPEASPLLPKAEPGEPHPLETWYRAHVMGGAGSFVLPADGYADFGRAIRQKFVIEISGIFDGQPIKAAPKSGVWMADGGAKAQHVRADDGAGAELR